MEYLGQDFATQVAPRVVTLGIEDYPLPPPKEHLPAATDLADLRQWMQQPKAPEIFQRTLLALRQIQGDVVGDTPADPVPPDILTWLTRLALLYGVPFDTLVPNPQMLPTESIRFFYVDPNAINSLIDGALSLGVHSSQQQLFNEFARDTIRQAVHQSLPQIRTRLLGTAVPASDGSNSVTVTQPVAGFLLRSQAVSALPGLEINCYQSITQSNTEPEPTIPISPLRIDRLTKDVLLCLLPTVPAWIEFNEPKESFGFGAEIVQSTLQIYPRTVTGSQPGSPLQPEIPQPIPFRGTSTVVDVGALQTAIQQRLQGQLNNPDGIISPAEFAIQLIQAPESMVFQNHTQSFA
jgi:hypothetical protein